MLRTVVTFVYISWPLKLGAFSLGVENYHIPFLKSKDMNFSALTDTFVLPKKKKCSFPVWSWGHLEAGILRYLMEERLKHNIQSWHEPREREWKEKLFHFHDSESLPLIFTEHLFGGSQSHNLWREFRSSPLALVFKC